MARSRGVTIYGTYAVVVGGVNAAANLGLVFMAPQLAQGAPPNPKGFLVGAVLGASLFASGLGAFRLKPWGRTLGIVLAALNLALLLAGLIRPPAAVEPTKQAAYLVTTALLLLFNGGLIWFFTRPAVAAQFRRP